MKTECKQVGQIVANGLTEMTGRIYGTEGISPATRTFSGGNTEIKIKEDDMKLRIRKLTEGECMRLMGYIDEEIEPLLNEFSKTAVYKFAGNSVVVDCFTAITNEILKDMDGKNVTLEGWLE